MKLFYSPTSPFVRKVLVMAMETGQIGRIQKIPAAVTPVSRDPVVAASNPLGKLPALVLEDGSTLYDSRVIGQYLDAQHSGPRLYPLHEPARWIVLRWEALADGLLDAAVLARYETLLRPADRQWPDWITGQLAKVAGALDAMEAEIDRRPDVDAGTIAAACALGYLDFRFAGLSWRQDREKLANWYAAFAQRASMRATWPADA